MPNFQHEVQTISTPFYLYDLDGLRARAEFFKSHMPKSGVAHFALKANNNPQVVQVLKQAGFGVDVVSSGEMNLALQLGFEPKQIVFSGIGKSADEIRLAINHQISQINVESIPELERIALIAAQLGKIAQVALRMNPDVDVSTHPYIRTGFRENKFGLDFSEVPNIIEILKKNSSTLNLRGLTLHIGSQIRETTPFKVAILKTLDLFLKLKADGFALTTLDVGGGIGIDYASRDFSQDEMLISTYMTMVKEVLEGKVEQIFFEPGRILVARFGSLITEIQYVKCTPFKNFLIVDAGMHLLMRPSLYQAFHRIEALHAPDFIRTVQNSSTPTKIFDVVGPICESSDVIGVDRDLPLSIKSGDRLIIHDVGAYGAVMSSRYNLHAPVRELCLQNGKIKDGH